MPTSSIHIHESIKPHKIIRSIQSIGDDYQSPQLSFFETPVERMRRKRDAINFNQAAHVVRTNLVSHWLPWSQMKRRILMYKTPVIPDRHQPRHIRPRRLFYLNYRPA